MTVVSQCTLTGRSRRWEQTPQGTSLNSSFFCNSGNIASIDYDLGTERKVVSQPVLWLQNELPFGFPDWKSTSSFVVVFFCFGHVCYADSCLRFVQIQHSHVLSPRKMKKLGTSRIDIEKQAMASGCHRSSLKWDFPRGLLLAVIWLTPADATIPVWLKKCWILGWAFLCLSLSSFVFFGFGHVCLCWRLFALCTGDKNSKLSRCSLSVWVKATTRSSVLSCGRRRMMWIAWWVENWNRTNCKTDSGRRSTT